MPRIFKSLVMIATLCSGIAFSKPATEDLVIYSYDSFMAKDGLGQKIIPLFEGKCGCKVKAISVGDGAQILTRVQLDDKRKKPTTHLVVGIDGPTWQLIKPYAEEWGDWRPTGYGEIDENFKRGNGFLPFDYGYMTFIADQKSLKKTGLSKPSSFKELLGANWQRQLILEDPRTSTPGLSFLLFFNQIDPGNFPERIRQLKKQWLTLAPGWDAAYGLFLKNEAPLVWSYITSQAYHEEDGDVPSKEKPRRYEAVILEEGSPLQIEGAALIKGAFKNSRQRELAKEFLNFMLSPEVQILIPKHNWMFPVVAKTPLPESFRNLPKPKKVVILTEDRSGIDNVMRAWMRAIH